MQKLENEFAMNIIPKPLNDNEKVEMLSGDRDVFGDGSLTIISTPGHIPGYKLLLVKLPKTGAIILTGDLVHFQYYVGQEDRPAVQLQQGAVACLDRARRQATRRAQGATLDQPRQGYHCQDHLRADVYLFSVFKRIGTLINCLVIS